jgi:hypothetical protein
MHGNMNTKFFIKPIHLLFPAHSHWFIFCFSLLITIWLTLPAGTWKVTWDLRKLEDQRDVSFETSRATYPVSHSRTPDDHNPPNSNAVNITKFAQNNARQAVYE